jgi:hypothetical protein
MWSNDIAHFKLKSQKIKVSADQISKCANPSYTHKSSLIKLSIMPSDCSRFGWTYPLVDDPIWPT